MTLRYTLGVMALLLVAETAIFAVLYEATIAVYERDVNVEIDADAADLARRLTGRPVDQMVLIVMRRCNEEPGENAEYMLAGLRHEYLAGNVHEWPKNLHDGAALVDLELGPTERPFEIHRVRALTLASGQHVLVGRNLTELEEIRALIRAAMGRVLLVTLVFGGLGGLALSRVVSKRLERINRESRAILAGDIARRMPVSGSGDEFDRLALNLNRMLDRIESLMNDLREVTDNVAHDLRLPFTRLRSRIELALMKPADPTMLRETLFASVAEIDRILEIFGALLAIAAAESRLPQERFARCDLLAIARSSAEVYEPVADEAGLSIEVSGPEPVWCLGDRDLLAQSLANLLDNAVKYAPASSVVSVSVSARGDRGVIVVADRGPGIPEEFREKAFERFARLDPTRSQGGSGLGLSLVRAVVRLHEGSVALEDNRPGLRVRIEIPRIAS